METPIFDFVDRYIEGGAARLHVPGHKGRGSFGIEARDITEIAGADALYEAEGIIAESEKNAAGLFGSAATFYSCEGSSLCIRAMLYLALVNRERGAEAAVSAERPVALAARNAHKAFLYAAALCDFDVEWLFPEADSDADLNAVGECLELYGQIGFNSRCACPVTPAGLAARLQAMAVKPFCVYVTSPDYLGGMQDIAGLSRVCRAFGVPLLVDNAHGAYLKFLPQSRHPIDLGADMCCDSAHKTLPALTGGAYLHISKGADWRHVEGARGALSLFGSTSPSYLILQSLDLCNASLAEEFPARLAAAANRVAALKRRLSARGFHVLPGEPMKLTLAGDGFSLADRLRAGGVECEYADRNHAVLMFAPDNSEVDYARIERALNSAKNPQACAAKGRHTRRAAGTGEKSTRRSVISPARAMTIREAMFAPSEVIPVREALGRVCAAPAVACPPAIPIAVSGEVISEATVSAFLSNGIEAVRVVSRADGIAIPPFVTGEPAARCADSSLRSR